MNSDFSTLVEEVKKLPSEDKEELKFLIEKYLAEEQREEIYQNFLESQMELQNNELMFTKDINKLKEMLTK